MTAMLHIATGLSLPLDAVTQTLAAIGRKGAGKTYLATMLAEQMLDAQAQVIVLDPVGNWWGLRVGANGKAKGKEIFVVGGDHGDVPLSPESGARIAQLLVEKGISAVLDVSAFRMGERKRFAAAFGEELFHLKKSRKGALHLFIEEAQLFAPQRPGPDEARMLGAFENIVRLGRNYGIGATLITQRPQSVNKEVLSQVECLCVLQVNGTHERKALEEWVQEAGADRKLVGELPGLERGEGYVWSPSWLRIFKRVRFAKKSTFDASATPEVGKTAHAAKLSTVDVEALRADLAEVVAQAEKDDPAALRRRIAELEKQMKSAKSDVQVKEVPMLTEAQMKRLEKLVEKSLSASAKCEEAAQAIARVVAPHVPLRSSGIPTAAALLTPTGTAQQMPPPVNRRVAVAPRAPAGNHQATGAADLGAGERRMVEALARRHPNALTRAQVGALSGFSASGGTFRNYAAAIKRAGLVEENASGMRLTAAGIAQAGAALGIALDPAAIRSMWQRALGAGEWRMVEVLIANHPAAVTRGELGARSGFEAAGGTFRNYAAAIKRVGLATEDRAGLRAVDELVE
jgi:hypothetical protein